MDKGAEVVWEAEREEGGFVEGAKGVAGWREEVKGEGDEEEEEKGAEGLEAVEREVGEQQEGVRVEVGLVEVG